VVHAGPTFHAEPIPSSEKNHYRYLDRLLLAFSQFNLTACELLHTAQTLNELSPGEDISGVQTNNLAMSLTQRTARGPER
jgi:hypothetical protein